MKNSGPECIATLFIPAAAKTSGSIINMHVIPSTIGSLKCGMVAWLTKHLTQNTDDFCISDKEVSKIFHLLNYYFVRMGHRWHTWRSFGLVLDVWCEVWLQLSGLGQKFRLRCTLPEWTRIPVDNKWSPGLYTRYLCRWCKRKYWFLEWGIRWCSSSKTFEQTCSDSWTKT